MAKCPVLVGRVESWARVECADGWIYSQRAEGGESALVRAVRQARRLSPDFPIVAAWSSIATVTGDAESTVIYNGVESDVTADAIALAWGAK